MQSREALRCFPSLSIVVLNQLANSAATASFSEAPHGGETEGSASILQSRATQAYCKPVPPLMYATRCFKLTSERPSGPVAVAEAEDEALRKGDG